MTPPFGLAYPPRFLCENMSSEIAAFTLRLLATSFVDAPLTLSIIVSSPAVQTSPSQL